jgi:hypothetical protein
MNFSKTYVLAGIALVMTLATVGSSGRPGAGYLAKVGPTPLRFQEGRDSRPPSLSPLAMDDRDIPTVTAMPPKAEEPTPVVRYSAASLPPQPQNYYLPWMPWFYPTPTFSNPEAVPAPGFESPTNGTSLSLPAGDLLNLTPQMLVDYFKPLQRGTNPPNTSGVPPVNFVPATPAPTSPSTGAYRAP